MADVIEVFKKGHNQTDSIALRKAIIDTLKEVLKKNDATKPTEADLPVVSWPDMWGKIDVIYKNYAPDQKMNEDYDEDDEDDQQGMKVTKDKMMSAIRSVLKKLGTQEG